MNHLFLQGKSELLLPAIADASLDACVTDPPYELGFMGKTWDSSGIAYSIDLWREIYRVLKPGAHLLAFGGTRTYHRMVCAIEDAGFEIRDQIQWLYGSGFPKSLDVSKAIDKTNGVEGTWRREDHPSRPGVRTTPGIIINQADHRTDANPDGLRHVYEPSSENAKVWSGWGTALKPANEPIVLARKPLEKGLTVAQNVLKYGTGVINIDGCRIDVSDDDYERNCSGDRGHDTNRKRDMDFAMTAGSASSIGRWPANVIHDGSDEVLAHFPNVASGEPAGIKAGGQGNCYGEFAGGIPVTGYGDEGSAARFFYCAKTSKADRNHGLDSLPDRLGGMRSNTSGQHITRRDGGAPGPTKNHHPTVKPTELMRYLCRLVTPPGGIILDPFLGSGSTAKAALIERFKIVGIEMDAEYLEIAQNRLNEIQVNLF